MGINTLEYSTIMRTKLDQQMLQGLVTGFMDSNSGDIIYEGGNRVKIPTLSMQGLGDYDRDKGFVQGSVTLTYKDHTMTQDRGRTFMLDAMDVNETNFVANATTLSSEFQRLHVIPEVDSYRLSKLFAFAKSKSRVLEGFTPTKATILDKLQEHITGIKDVIGDNVELVIIMSTPVKTILAQSLENSRRIDVGNFEHGKINTQVHTFDEIPILTVPSARFKTLYKKNDGSTVGQEVGGLVPDTAAKDINWIIVAKRAPIAVVKQDKFRIFTPDENQKADAWKIDYRKYHDMWINESYAPAIFACSKA